MQPLQPTINEENVPYASFTERLLAYFIDVALFLPLTAIEGYNIIWWKRLDIMLLVILIWCIYKPVMEWKFGATLGKKIMQLRVVNYDYEAINFNQAMLRFAVFFARELAKAIAYFKLFMHPAFAAFHFESMGDLNEFMLLQQDNPDPTSSLVLFFLLFSVTRIIFDPERQAHHDKIACTYCIKTNSKKRVTK